MTIKLVALYRRPDDVDAFMRHYTDVHMPLVQQIPHLESAVVAEVTGSPQGEAPYFLMAQMSFPDQARFDEAMRSPENRAAGRDIRSFAEGLVTLMVVREPPEGA